MARTHPWSIGHLQADKSPKMWQTWSLSEWPSKEDVGATCASAPGCWVTVAAAAAAATAARPGMKMSCEERGALKERLTCRIIKNGKGKCTFTAQSQELFRGWNKLPAHCRAFHLAHTWTYLDCERKGGVPTFQLIINYQFIYLGPGCKQRSCSNILTYIFRFGQHDAASQQEG